MKYYHYFVSYFSSYGPGMAEYLTNKKISSFDDILKMQKLIAEKLEIIPCGEIVPINYQLINDIPY